MKIKVEKSKYMSRIYNVYKQFLFVFWIDQGSFWSDTEDKDFLISEAQKFMKLKEVCFEA